MHCQLCGRRRAAGWESNPRFLGKEVTGPITTLRTKGLREQGDNGLAA